MAETNVLSSGGYLMGMALAGPESFSQQQLAYLKQALGLDETVIWTPPTGYEYANNYAIVLTESIHNFSEIAVYCKAPRASGLQDTSKNVYPVSDSGNTMFADGYTSNHWNNNNNDNGFYYQGIDIRLTNATGYIGGNYRWGIKNGTTTWECSRSSDNNSIYLHPYKIVGIHRVASN